MNFVKDQIVVATRSTEGFYIYDRIIVQEVSECSFTNICEESNYCHQKIKGYNVPYGYWCGRCFRLLEHNESIHKIRQ